MTIFSRQPNQLLDAAQAELPMEQWLRTDEFAQAVVALELVGDQLALVPSDPHHWQWTCVALHNAVQSFMVLALRGSTNLGVLTEESAQEWREAMERRDGVWPKEERLASFLDLYKRTKSKAMQQFTDSRALVPTGSQGRSVKLLNKLRNEFVHFTPKGWSLEVSGLPRVVSDVVNVIEFLAFNCGNVRWDDSALRRRTETAVDRSRNQLAKLGGV